MFACACQKKFQVVQSVISVSWLRFRGRTAAPRTLRGRTAHACSRRRVTHVKIVLASTSLYRRELLQRLQIPFTTADPGVDEAANPGERPEALVERLARAKAMALAAAHPDALIVGCDQVAVSGGVVVGKPGNRENAVRQLREMSGRDTTFYTAVCVHDAASGRTSTRVIPYLVRLRPLNDDVIERYLEREQPYDCAGSAKSEGLGIALIERMEGEDPNALIGLPLIALVDLLAEHGVQIP